MINKTIRLVTLGLVVAVGVNAQSVEDGVKALYNGKIAGAKSIFEKNISKPEAAYWLAQAFIADNDKAGAEKVIDAALAAKANEPILLVGKGQLQLMDRKTTEATQSFETAITGSRGRKGDDPVILNAIGKAITKVFNNNTKIGDINYAVQKLEAASAASTKDNWLKADIFTNLGDAYRKAKPGDGTAAFGAYQSALSADPNFANAYYRLGLIFKSQKNWELFLDNMNKAVGVNAAFLPAYDELFLYRIGKLDNAGAQEIATKIVQHSDPNPNNDYYIATTQFLAKNYDQAIATANGIIGKAGDATKPKVYKLLAYSYLEKGDTATAATNVDKYFAKEDKDEIVAADYALRAFAYAGTPGKEEQAYNSFIEGAAATEVLADKIDLLQNGAKFFANKEQNALQAGLLTKIIELKKDPVINDYFYAGIAYYRAGKYKDSWKIFDNVRTKFPAQNYGYLWSFRNSTIYDTVPPSAIAVADAEKLIAFSKTDSASDAKDNLYLGARFLGIHNFNTVKNNTKAIEYLNQALEAATSEAKKQEIQGFIQIVSKTAPKPSAAKQNTTKANTAG